MVENLHYARLAADAGLGTWIVRGFGTALMHGGVTAIYTIATLAPEEKARWKKTTQPVVDAWIANSPHGKALHDEAVAVIAEYDK